MCRIRVKPCTMPWGWCRLTPEVREIGLLRLMILLSAGGKTWYEGSIAMPRRVTTGVLVHRQGDHSR